MNKYKSRDTAFIDAREKVVSTYNNMEQQQFHDNQIKNTH